MIPAGGIIVKPWSRLRFADANGRTYSKCNGAVRHVNADAIGAASGGQERGVGMDVVTVSRRGADRWLRRLHPWIYRSDVSGGGGAAGGVWVRDESGRRLGTGLWSPASEISIRMLTTDTVELDASFWRSRIENAAAYRASLSPRSTAYRLVHGEADGLPSLIVDRYGPYVAAQFLSAGLEAHRGEIVEALAAALAPAGMVARNDVPVRRHEGLPRSVELLWGAVPAEVEVEEAGVRYIADLWEGQKTGAFLDQRENRARAGELSRGRTLDCFAYHGSFALHLARRADRVVAVDSSAPALERARANAELNGRAIETVEANVFEFLRAEESAGRRYDVIVLDPPAFAKSRGSVGGALRGYKEINLRAMRLLAPGGHLCTFSCSFHVDRQRFRAMLEAAAADAGRSMRWIESRGQALDHPEVLQVPESGYLKGAILRGE